MTEMQIKEICKWIVENRRRPLLKEQKEMIKQAIDNSKTIEELFITAVILNLIG